MEWVVSERMLFSLVLLWVIRSPVLSKPTAILFLLDVFVGSVYPLQFTTVLIKFSRFKCGACSRAALIRIMYEVTKSRTGILQCVYSYFEEGCRKKCTRQSQRYCGWLWIHCPSKTFERMTREAMDVCLLVLKLSNKSRFDGYSVRNSDHIPYYLSGLSRAHFSDNLYCHFFIRKGTLEGGD